jgi:Protein of unknown function (DUF1549)/Protein of unknown function (DUF1553)
MKAWSVLGAMMFSSGLLAADKVITPWSFEPLMRPAVPARSGDWARDELDHFILLGLSKAGLTPSPDASRSTMIRRVTLDLHGLLPTPGEVDSFVRDPAADDQALATVVDRLLRSPRFGERWARHWLDVVRYAESTGRSWNAPLVYAFRYRDWVIDSFNQDKPYTRFMAEQVAGDLLPVRSDAERSQAVQGTGFLALGSMDLVQGQYEQYRMDLVDDQIDVTTRAFLGLTVACARCHDHKTDPVTQHDYYALAGLFYSTDTHAGTADRMHLGASLYVDLDRLIRLPVATLISSVALKAGEQNLFDEPIAEPGMGMATAQGGRYVTTYVQRADIAMGVSDGDAANCPIRIAGDPDEEGKTPHRGDWRIPKLPLMPKIAGQASGRAELAQWLSTTTHPLTSRVMVNRLWAHLFGRGLVTTVDNFGISGEKPEHPELLDHLAVRFVTEGWSVKKMLRAMVLSRSYRQSSAGSRVDAQAVDPANTLVWRMKPKRMEVEVLRDTLLQIGGVLTFDRPSDIQIAGNGGKGKDARTRSLMSIDSSYRSLYLPVLRDLLPEMYDVWDFPNPTQIKGEREVTTVAPQALFLMNNRMVVDCASALAEQVRGEFTDDDKAVQQLHRILFGRLASAQELKDADDYLIAEDSWSSYVQALIASAEFRYAL